MIIKCLDALFVCLLMQLSPLSFIIYSILQYFHTNYLYINRHI